MNNILHVKKEIEEIIRFLILNSMVAFQQFPIIKEYPENIKKIEWNTVSNLAICLKNVDYDLIYSEINKNRDYTFKFIDGNIIQLLYTFENNELYSHRLAMFPSPDLESFQNSPEIYEKDEVYADIIAKNLVPFPIRFDYCKDEVLSEYKHPFSHATLGQYKNCRIPVYGPVSPYKFIKFVLENFYNSFYEINKMSLCNEKCSKIFTIRKLEKKQLHLNIE